MTKELNQYYQEVRSHLSCPKGERDRLLAQAHQMVVELQESDPNLGYSGVVDFLGEPQELASTFMERMDPAMVEGYKKKKKRIRISIIALVVAVIAALSVFTVYALRVQSEVEITREDTLIISEDEGSESSEQNDDGSIQSEGEMTE